jgi:hypothetical protein
VDPVGLHPPICELKKKEKKQENRRIRNEVSATAAMCLSDGKMRSTDIRKQQGTERVTGEIQECKRKWHDHV